MAALREAELKTEVSQDARREVLREAFMRQTIRVAVREGFERIAVVCGAWHAPVQDFEARSVPCSTMTLRRRCLTESSASTARLA